MLVNKSVIWQKGSNEKMTKKLTSMQLRMAALGNHMMEAGAELYENPEVREKIKDNISKKKTGIEKKEGK